ncbi:enoyl-CoA hydratase-related protein [uncultured Alsobacter sp.]|uniref:enoyl-CoA hydratase-related protein n=1 Tax=uncultured Alsobacter sp. TaxID=1748258 RepID=UPI0025EDEEF3|nr:enoyl-CoA hydratase-related protein [uncultured Alsobacter sp.]
MGGRAVLRRRTGAGAGLTGVSGPSEPAPGPGARAERIGDVLVVTIDRPHVRNAVDADTSFLIDRLVGEGEADPAVGAIVLTGAGDRAFCSGMDMKEAAVRGAGHGLIPGRGFCGVTERRVAKPLIAAINGHAVAGGFELALACDLVVAAEGAVFALPEVKRGLVAFTGGVQRLARQLPRAAAMEIILCAAAIPAQRLCELGVVNRVVPAPRVLPEALALAQTMLANGWSALRHARALFDDAQDVSMEEAIAIGHRMGAQILNSPESREGVGAYAEHRSARFVRE